jgi:hypothetical protein
VVLKRRARTYLLEEPACRKMELTAIRVLCQGTTSVKIIHLTKGNRLDNI